MEVVLRKPHNLDEWHVNNHAHFVNKRRYPASFWGVHGEILEAEEVWKHIMINRVGCIVFVRFSLYMCNLVTSFVFESLADERSQCVFPSESLIRESFNDWTFRTMSEEQHSFGCQSPLGSYHLLFFYIEYE